MLIRKCPECQKEIFYSTKGSCNTATKNNSLCRKCTSIKTGFTQRYSAKENSGSNNPFYGKKHTKKTKEKIANKQKGRKKTIEELSKLSENNSGSRNPMYGKTVYSIWLKKYGKIEADKREKKRKKRLSKRFSGKKNPMYGVPTPQGSGNGWKGWFCNHFFRSLRELMYMIYLNDNNIHWTSGEILSIPYIFNNKKRTYRPDFIIGNKIIEIKPIRLHNTPNIIAKTNALAKYCFENSLEYEIIDINIDKNKIKENVSKGSIKFIKKYEDKFNLWIKD